ncbi:hypothetical protein BDV35DRAFT_114992 [Aspergillus flavus]|uniref:Secreted protein n=1 Tax=Aspergillus flavus TaxID=5059 RepID=A0A5N6H5S5_ASPFL|nr:hypothetical protein BDV35DRAFT_114992 [Aspergillus flavus]
MVSCMFVVSIPAVCVGVLHVVMFDEEMCAHRDIPLHSLIIQRIISARFVFLYDGSRLSSHVIYHSRKNISKSTHRKNKKVNRKISRPKQQNIYTKPPTHRDEPNSEGCKSLKINTA